MRKEVCCCSVQELLQRTGIFVSLFISDLISQLMDILLKLLFFFCFSFMIFSHELSIICLLFCPHCLSSRSIVNGSWRGTKRTDLFLPNCQANKLHAKCNRYLHTPILIKSSSSLQSWLYAHFGILYILWGTMQTMLCGSPLWPSLQTCWQCQRIVLQEKPSGSVGTMCNSWETFRGSCIFKAVYCERCNQKMSVNYNTTLQLPSTLGACLSSLVLCTITLLLFSLLSTFSTKTWTWTWA